MVDVLFCLLSNHDALILKIFQRRINEEALTNGNFLKVDSKLEVCQINPELTTRKRLA